MASLQPPPGAAPSGPGRRWRPSPLLWLSAAVHAGAAGGLLVSPAQWALAAGAVFANHLVLAGAGMWPRSSLLGPNLTRLPPGQAAAAVALTFDDGPDPRVTPGILELLAAAGARASFFCIGRRARRHPELVAEIARRGHRVENHTFHHSNGFALLPPAALGREIDLAQQALVEAAGSRPLYFRAPAGIRSPWLEPLLARRGLRLASWTRRGFDAVDTDGARVARRLVKGLAAGDVLLLHDGRAGTCSVGRSNGRPPAVLDALARVLDRLAAAGLAAVSLPAERARRRESR